METSVESAEELAVKIMLCKYVRPIYPSMVRTSVIVPKFLFPLNSPSSNPRLSTAHFHFPPHSL